MRMRADAAQRRSKCGDELPLSKAPLPLLLPPVKDRPKEAEHKLLGVDQSEKAVGRRLRCDWSKAGLPSSSLAGDDDGFLFSLSFSWFCFNISLFYCRTRLVS